MNMDYNDIKNDIIDHWEQLSEMAHPEDLLTELADSACPVYYSGILKDWTEMPNAFTDSWQESTEPTQNTTIFSLMLIDLFNYYNAEYAEIFDEVKDEKESEETEEELENA